jgi:signal transduction histidine kinase
MRDIVELIHRPAETGDDFVGKLRVVAARQLTGLDWNFTVEVAPTLPTLTAQRHLLLAFKEALHNIRKHSAAHRVEVSIFSSGDQLCLKIVDDGVGFDPKAAVEGHGLANLRHRATALGGELVIASAPGRGTTLTLSLSLTARRSPSA